MIESATKWSREKLERLRDRGGDSRFGAPTLALAGLAGAVGEFFLDPRSGRRRRAAVVERIGALIPRRRSGDDAPTLDDSGVESRIRRGHDAPSQENGHSRGKAKRQAAIRSK